MKFWQHVRLSPNLSLGEPGSGLDPAHTCRANRREHSVSPTDAGSGLMLTNMSVFPSPPKHGCAIHTEQTDQGALLSKADGPYPTGTPPHDKYCEATLYLAFRTWTCTEADSECSYNVHIMYTTPRYATSQEAHLEQVCELGVAVGHMCALGSQRAKNVPQAAQRLVDRARLLLALPHGFRSIQPLTAGVQHHSALARAQKGYTDHHSVATRHQQGKYAM